ncbi:MAG TPA: hypothetical protein VFJ74_07330 [Gemmatimonadaceae bacterium]|nr:hypothetical protein [Gemmatimonadaceae bacterium]
MPRHARLLLVVAFIAPTLAAAQSLPRASLALGADAIGVVTRVSPAVEGRDLTEGYLTQPVLMAHATLLGGAVVLRATLDGEGRTIRRGELTAGAYGEGYVDRRHPHTYVHELLASLATPAVSLGGIGAARASVTGGKGFAPFGTDDPMARPFVKYPVNHHLSQILERAIVVGALRVGPVAVEGGVFDGDEPEGPADAPNARRFGDSRAARVTVRAHRGGGAFELQGSAAHVASPEIPTGGGADQTKWSTSLRYERDAAVGGTHDMPGMPGMPDMPAADDAATSRRAVVLRYALAELALTREGVSGSIARPFRYPSLLGEAEVLLWRGRGTVALRVERTVRPEEERLIDPFRSTRPPTDLSILGRTRWDIVTAHVATRAITRAGLRATPFVEVARAHAIEEDRPSLFQPSLFYGAATQWHLSAGVRVGIGMRHGRMGRYGVAAW